MRFTRCNSFLHPSLLFTDRLLENAFAILNSAPLIPSASFAVWVRPISGSKWRTDIRQWKAQPDRRSLLSIWTPLWDGGKNLAVHCV